MPECKRQRLSAPGDHRSERLRKWTALFELTGAEAAKAASPQSGDQVRMILSEVHRTIARLSVVAEVYVVAQVEKVDYQLSSNQVSDRRIERHSCFLSVFVET